MIAPIRLATEEEIKSIAETSDLQMATKVLAWGQGGNLVLGVLRTPLELDPVYYNNATARDKAMFVWGVENYLRLSGVPAYYFNVPAGDDMASYREIAEKFGAINTSKEPEFRYKKVL